MVVIPEDVKKQLKRPLGRLYGGMHFLRKTGKMRIISVGDDTTLALLESGITPHLAVFDFKVMRKRIPKKQQKILLSSFGKIRKYKNPKGTLSDYILKNAKMLIREGGAVLIAGEEDLVTLALIIDAKKDDIILYGQPKKGVVKVSPDKRLKNKVRKMLSAAGALGHKVK